MRQIKVFLLLLIFPAALVWAQDGEDSSARLLMIKGFAESNDPEIKETALIELENLLSQSPTPEEKDGAVDILQFLASEGITTITYEGMALSKESSAIGAGAAELLGFYGDEGSVRTLVNVMNYGNDILPVGAAVTASSQITTENRGSILQAYGRILNVRRTVYDHEALILITLEAVARLSESNEDVFENSEIMDGLSRVSRGSSGYRRKTRNMALELIREAKMRKEAN
ncbi:MAG: hypothetical protein PQJ59_17225 [Spirochaetales bacterium]|nr:hypothetical protein [Spirochaetales bacterium]